jgi:hypothetical protein
LRLVRSFAGALLVALLGAAISAEPTAPARSSAQPASAAERQVPPPAASLGFEPCADYKLATYEQIADYFKALAAAAPDRMRLVDMGRTVEGRTQWMAIITSEENMRDLERYQRIARALALTRDGSERLTDEDARALARDGKAVVWIDFGLHSSEVAHAQTAPLVAYKAVSDESDEMRAIRDNVIFLLVPNMNPDGTTMVADWYMKNVGKPWESRVPELWHTYVGHDDNRDWFMMTQPETRNSARQLYSEWFPQIVYNQHQAGPFPSRIFVPPFDDPMNPNIPPLVMRGVNLVGDAMTRRLDREGKPGAVSRVGFDTWWNGGMRTAPYFHNMIGILTETSHASATPTFNDPANFPKTFSNGAPTLAPSTYYPSPYRGGEWHMRQSCDYMVTTSMATLDIAAKRRQEWLYDVYQMGRDAARANADETFLIPADQWDPGTAVKLVNTLRLGGIQIERALDRFTADGREYAAGTFVIRGAQPFEPYVKDLLSPQRYPDLRVSPDLPPRQPYDITGWTLSYQMGVRAERVNEAVNVRTASVDVAPQPEAVVPDNATGVWALDPRANDSFTAVNRLLTRGLPVYRAPLPLDAGGSRWPAGAFLVPLQRGMSVQVAAIARSLGLSVRRVDRLPQRAVPLKAPRIAVYHAWGGNMDEGWTRWVLEQYEFPFTKLHDQDVRAGNLAAQYDVILLPDATYRQMVNGFGPGSMPPEYVGGLTDAGVANLRAFVDAGGVLVAMDRAAELPLSAFGIPVRNVTAGQRQRDFFIPGSILRVQVDNSRPLAFGMPPEAAAFFINSPAFAVEASDRRLQVVARYPAQDLLMSGWILGEPLIAGQAAVLDVPVGRGHVVLLGFRTEHRGQPHGTFKFLFNSLYLNNLQPR